MPAKDISKASSMSRNATILYRNRKPKGEDPASFGGLLKLTDGQVFWCYLWPRKIGEKDVVELRLVPKREGSGVSD
jgi:hypothetical protein